MKSAWDELLKSDSCIPYTPGTKEKTFMVKRRKFLKIMIKFPNQVT